MNSDGNDHMPMSGNPAGDGGSDPELLGFVERFLHAAGAAVETNAHGLDALLPEELQALLNASEHIQIRGNAAASDANDDYYGIGYGTPLLDKMIQTALTKIPLLFCRVAFDYVKSGGFDRLLDHQFTFYGAVTEIETVADIFADYLLMVCRYKAVSDEQKEGLVELVINADTKKIVPDMADHLHHSIGRMVFSEDFETKDASCLSGLGSDLEKHAVRLLRRQLQTFHESMNRRFRRDVNNLTEYYAGLEKEMMDRLESSTLSDNARKDRQAKIDDLPAELARKTDDLFKKHSIKVTINPAAVMIIRSPAKKIICKLSAGRQTKRFSFIYNPVIRAMEPPACAHCGEAIYHIHFNGKPEMVCFDCRGK